MQFLSFPTICIFFIWYKMQVFPCFPYIHEKNNLTFQLLRCIIISGGVCMDSMYALSSFAVANKCDTENSLNVNLAGHVKLEVGIKNTQYRLDYYLIYVLDGSIALKNDNIQTKIRK